MCTAACETFPKHSLKDAWEQSTTDFRGQSTEHVATVKKLTIKPLIKTRGVFEMKELKG